VQGQTKGVAVVKAHAFKHAVAIQKAVIEDRHFGFGRGYDTAVNPAAGLLKHGGFPQRLLVIANQFREAPSGGTDADFV
jgi:hypothetical protein